MGLASLHAEVMDNGPVFAAVFYLTTGLSMLSTLAGLVSSLSGPLSALAANTVFAVVLIGLLWRERLYLVLYLTLLLPVMVVLFGVTALLPVLMGQSLLLYTVLVLLALPPGLLAAYMFGKVASSDAAVLAPAITGSTGIAVIAGMVAVLARILREVASAFEAPAGGVGGGLQGGMALFNLESVASPVMVLAVLLVGFNGPFLYRYWREQRNLRLLGLYLLPLLVYAAFVLATDVLAGSILSIS